MDQIQDDDRRLRGLALGILAGLALLAVGLWYVQVVSAEKYRNSLRGQTYRTVRVPAVRGKIFDRNRTILAENRPSYNLSLYIEELRPQFDAEFSRLRGGRRLTRAERAGLRQRARYNVVSNTVARVAAILQAPLQVAERNFVRHHEQWPYRPLPLLENLTPTQTARFLEQAPDAPGLELERQAVRYYPYGAAVAHVLGYLSRDDLAREDEEASYNYSLPCYQGAVGAEFAFEKELAGRPGVKAIEVNSLCYRESEQPWSVAEPGQNLILALDLPLQRAAAQALSPGGTPVRGAIVVLDVANGDVLAMASSPAYDPNEFVQALRPEHWQRLNDPQTKIMFNRATHGAYPPGSTFKIVTALACLETGVLHAGNLSSRFNSPGYFQLGRRRIDDLAPPGDYDFRRAFIRSSNTYFINYGLKAGRRQLLEMGRRFCLGEKTGLPTRQDAAGSFPQPEEVERLWNEGNTANVCIGQEITVTPLQMAVLTAAVANGGKVLYPRLVQRVESPEPGLDGTSGVDFPPRLRRELGIDPAHLAIVRNAMRADVDDSEGTGKAARVAGLAVCGKTGTAQVRKPGRIDHITWFTSFAPFEQPRFAVTVMVENGASGGGTCAPLARGVYEAIQRRFYPGTAQPPRLAGH